MMRGSLWALVLFSLVIYFYLCKNLKIYCEADEKPEGFDDEWNPDNLEVVWGYQESLISPFVNDFTYWLFHNFIMLYNIMKLKGVLTYG